MLVAWCCVSCKPKPVEVDPVCGHWGCETYVSCRYYDDGSEYWETFDYEVGSDRGYEVLLRQDGTGKIWLHESPALFKVFSFSFGHDHETEELVVQGNDPLLSLYYPLLAENGARLQIEALDNTHLTLSWMNFVSESDPFFERFYLKKIE